MSSHTRAAILYTCKVREKEKCERSQLWSKDWCGERPFGQQASHHLFYNIFE